MNLARIGAVALLAFAVTGCGPAIPPAGNYATVSGKVTDATTGAGLPGAVVSVNVVQSSTSDASGNFKITGVPTGPWSYAVQAPAGYANPPANDQAPSLAPGENRVLNFALTKT